MPLLPLELDPEPEPDLVPLPLPLPLEPPFPPLPELLDPELPPLPDLLLEEPLPLLLLLPPLGVEGVEPLPELELEVFGTVSCRSESCSASDGITNHECSLNATGLISYVRSAEKRPVVGKYGGGVVRPHVLYAYRLM